MTFMGAVCLVRKTEDGWIHTYSIRLSRLEMCSEKTAGLDHDHPMVMTGIIYLYILSYINRLYDYL